jgi:hypothetical protein
LVLLTQHLKLSVLEDCVSLVVPTLVDRVDVLLLRRRVALGGCLVTWSTERIGHLMEVWPRAELNICLKWLGPISRASWALLVLVQGWESLRMVLLLSAVGEHDRLAGRIFGR